MLAPVVEILVIVRLPLPLFVRVIVCGELVVLTAWLPNVRVVAERLTTGAAPVPVRLTVCGLPAALSAILTAAVRAPAAVGVNATLIVQLPPAATEPPHVLLTEKSPAFAPVRLMPLMLKLVFPVLSRVVLCAALVVPTFWLLKLRLDGVRLTDEAPPVPVRLTVCGLPAALSEMLTAAVRAPATVGVNVTLIVQLPPGTTALPQVLI